MGGDFGGCEVEGLVHGAHDVGHVQVVRLELDRAPLQHLSRGDGEGASERVGEDGY